jgi:hypothetical protein
MDAWELRGIRPVTLAPRQISPLASIPIGPAIVDEQNENSDLQPRELVADEKFWDQIAWNCGWEGVAGDETDLSTSLILDWLGRFL